MPNAVKTTSPKTELLGTKIISKTVWFPMSSSCASKPMEEMTKVAFAPLISSEKVPLSFE